MLQDKISKEFLYDLYVNQKLSTIQIGKRLVCGKTSISNLMKVYGIPARSRSETSMMIIHPTKYPIPKEDLEYLYSEEKLSMGQIGKIYGVHSSLIHSKLKRYKIPTRSFEEGNRLSIPRRNKSIALALVNPDLQPFSDNAEEKAYLFGFTAGDLNVTKRKYGECINIATSTTKSAQVELVKQLFYKYTPITVNKVKKGWNISFRLHMSFSFLLDYKQDKIPEEMINNDKLFINFLAGYIDAEGSFGIYGSYGSFFLGSYDKNILTQVHNKLKSLGIITEGPSLRDKKGKVDKRGVTWKNDLWAIRIRKTEYLHKFVSVIKPHVKHKKRYKDLISVETNVNQRIQKQKERSDPLLLIDCHRLSIGNSSRRTSIRENSS